MSISKSLAGLSLVMYHLSKVQFHSLYTDESPCYGLDIIFRKTPDLQRQNWSRSKQSFITHVYGIILKAVR